MLVGINECELDWLSFLAGKSSVYLHGEMVSLHGNEILDTMKIGELEDKEME